MKTISLGLFLLVAGAAKGQSVYYSENGIAINGFDAVSYINEGKAVKGNSVYAHQWGSTTWLFSSQSNLDLFKADPEKFAPQYGGWCAYGVSENHKSPTDPNAFTVAGGKLFLNYSIRVMQKWRSDTTQYIRRANQNWPALRESR